VNFRNIAVFYLILEVMLYSETSIVGWPIDLFGLAPGMSISSTIRSMPIKREKRLGWSFRASA
jgi:hypothetical protein